MSQRLDFDWISDDLEDEQYETAAECYVEVVIEKQVLKRWIMIITLIDWLKVARISVKRICHLMSEREFELRFQNRSGRLAFVVLHLVRKVASRPVSQKIKQLLGQANSPINKYKYEITTPSWYYIVHQSYWYYSWGTMTFFSRLGVHNPDSFQFILYLFL